MGHGCSKPWVADFANLLFADQLIRFHKGWVLNRHTLWDFFNNDSDESLRISRLQSIFDV
ncbi:hypothetical protein CQ052_19320 [Ochrobactrum sp. MYb15]|nr:hypothetical protein CQZ90_21225 [Ochrobactrum sp. MYb19]PRA60776.1 hypothetical protein CQ053_21010 [Ochrobactrum sp. MYb18]PRA73513.1 hypothetical protein CQ049_20830 [Brucella thiophenivorans]PRA85103.1 hypothetical protein CQ051_21235 [Ochrobactrum sp. MYb14]PRA94568.1 hypothetical protein CQ052_19320 [Ochrobactrum sp. MYb15]